MRVLRYLAKPRLNFFDVGIMGLSYGLMRGGSIAAGVAVLIFGLVVSAWLERKMGFRK